jgi:hypothetical protein
MSYSEYKFGDFRKYYESGPSDALVGFATGFADSFSSSFTAARAARNKADDDLFKLAVSDIQEREKAKAKASAKTTNYRSQAASLAANYPNLPGIEATIYRNLVGGMTANQIVSDLQSGIEDNRIRFQAPDGTITNPLEITKPEVKPEPEVDNEETSALNTQTDTVLSSNQSEDNSSELLLASLSTKNVDTDEGLAFETYQEAGIGDSWIDRVRQRQAEQRLNRVNARVDKWKEMTGRNVTSASGLTASNNTSPSVTTEVDAASNSGVAPLAAVGDAVGTLLIMPKDPKDTTKTLSERIDVTKANDSSKVLAALAALNLEENQQDPEVVAMRTQLEALQKDLQLFPDIGDMNENQLNEFIKTASNDPKYANVSPSILNSMIGRAGEYQTDLLNKALPSLTFSTAQEGEAILADLKGKNITTSKVYKDTLNSRIQVLRDLEEAKKQEDFVFDENSLKTLAFNARKEIYANDDLYKTQEAKEAAWALWQSTEGKALVDIYNMTDDEKVPTSFAELSVSVLMEQDEWENATPEEQQQMIAAAKANLDGSKSSTLTRSNLSAEHAEATLALTSSDPKIVAEASNYLKNIYPVKLSSIIASEAGGNDQTYAVTTEPGLIVSATQSINDKGETVYTNIATGEVIENPKSIQTEELDKSRAQAVRGASNLLSDQTKLMGAATNVAVMGYKLEELARRNPYVLTSAGKVNALFVSGRNELSAMLDIVGSASGDDNINEGTLVNQITNYLDNAVSSGVMNRETASVYQQFMGASIQYIFAAGKALGQTGNGFSNQDYKNIRNSLLTSNDIDTFAAGLQKFAKDRMGEASRAAVTLRGQTLITEAESYGAEFGNELNTAEEYFNSIREVLPNTPDTYGWAQGTVKIEVQNVNAAPEVVTKGTVDLIQPGEGLAKFNAQTITSYKSAVGEKPSQSIIDKALLSLTSMGYEIEYIKQEMPFLFPAADSEQE